MKKLGEKRGYSLIEITVALGLLAVGLLSILSLFSMGTRTSKRSIYCTEAILVLKSLAEEQKLITNFATAKNPVPETDVPSKYTNLKGLKYKIDVVALDSSNPDYKWVQRRVTVFYYEGYDPKTGLHTKKKSFSVDVFLDF